MSPKLNYICEKISEAIVEIKSRRADIETELWELNNIREELNKEILTASGGDLEHIYSELSDIDDYHDKLLDEYKKVEDELITAEQTLSDLTL